MSKKYMLPKKKYYKSRKFNNKCEKCGKQIPDKLAFCRSDESNYAITYNAPYLCWRCYNNTYENDKIGLFFLLKQIGVEIIVNEDKTIKIGEKVYSNIKEVNENFEKIIEQYEL